MKKGKTGKKKNRSSLSARRGEGRGEGKKTATVLARRADLPPPRVTAPRPLGPPQAETVREGLARVEGIEAAYEQWQELREHHRAALARLADERRKLEQQGEFVLGAVRAARDGA